MILVEPLPRKVERLMPSLLSVLPFTTELLDEVRGFDAGDELYQRELADWIQQDALVAMSRGTKVWLYVNEATEVVGYGSLGLTRWKYPTADSPKSPLLIIPAVALRRAFWGKPDGPSEDRYSSQIMRHLITEALAWPGTLPALGLFVHPSNLSAIKLYERFAFQAFHHSYTDAATGVTYRTLIRLLGRG